MIESELISSPGGDVVVIRLARPDKKNAMTPEMLAKLCNAIREARTARTLLICGAGDAFCSGFDLSMCLKDETVLPELLRGLSKAIRALRQHSSPVVAAVHGVAIAGGCALVAGSDVVITHDQCKLGYPVVRLGVSPAVNAPFVQSAMGSGPTRERLLDSALISGREAMRLGLAHESLPAAADVLPRAIEVAQSLAGKPRSGMEATKRLMNELDGTSLPVVAESALEASLALTGSAEEREALDRLFKK